MATNTKTQLDIKELQVEMKNISKDVCDLKDDVKVGFEALHRKLDDFNDKKADKDEVRNLKTWLGYVSAALIGFLIWALQELLKTWK